MTVYISGECDYDPSHSVTNFALVNLHAFGQLYWLIVLIKGIFGEELLL